MSKLFPYKIQATGRAYAEAPIPSLEIASTWNVVHKNPDEEGLWIIDQQTGYLRINSNQNGLSARYAAKDLDKKDYKIETEVIPSADDDDAFGIVFRYQDPFHFYFVAWDGGGEYGWGNRTLRLYKVYNNEYRLLAFNHTIGHWVGAQVQKMDVQVRGNEFIVYINDREAIRYTDDIAPYLQGAYGPCATSQVASWKKFFVRGEFDFMVEDEFQGEVDYDNIDYATDVYMSDKTVQQLMSPAVVKYMQEHGYTVASAAMKDYTLSVVDKNINIYFDTEPPSKRTTLLSSKVKAYMLNSDRPPTRPDNFKGTVDGVTILWTWKDTSNFEQGFEILDENDNVIATLGRNATEWLEGPLDEDTIYTRKVRSYNASGKSESAIASARTEDLRVFYTPAAPTNFRGMVQGTDAITWYWDKVSNADYYQVWDAVTHALLYTGPVPRFKEENLTPDTLYRRYVTATNVAGKSSPSVEGMAFTDPIPPVVDIPPAPLFFSAETIDDKTIRWSWQEPKIEVPLEYNGVPRPQEEIDHEIATILASLSYRVYDVNGEVLYEAPAEVFEFMETGLKPATAYTHYVKAIRDNVEGVRSNYAYATTLEAEPEVFPEEPEEPLPWPLTPEELVCIPYETEPAERIDAFHTGIGDNLDLKVRKSGQKPKYETGVMRRDIPEDADGDGEPDYGEDGTGGMGPGGPNSNNSGWPMGPDFDGGVDGGIGKHEGWDGWGPGNPHQGGHDPIGGGGYGSIGEEYFPPTIGDPIIGHGGDTGGTKHGQPGYIDGDELGMCTVDSPREEFMYETQIVGTEYVDIEVYDKECFQFRFKGEGMEETKGFINDFIGKLWVYPKKNVSFNVSADVDKPEPFNYYVTAKAEVRMKASNDVNYSIRPWADVLHSRLEISPSLDEIFKGPGASSWGPNTWTFDSATGVMVTNKNVSWSGFFNKNFMDFSDYEVECEMGVMDRHGDNDFISLAFRFQQYGTNNESVRFYYFGTDRGGTGLRGTWGLYKVNGFKPAESGNSQAVATKSTLIQAADMSKLDYDKRWEEGRWYKVRVVLVGTNIKVWLDDQLVVDAVDKDTDFKKGGWGPSTASQEGAAFRNFKFREGYIERVYGGDNLVEYAVLNKLTHTSEATAQVVTITPLNQIMTTAIADAHTRYVNQTGNVGSVARPVKYGAETNNLKIVGVAKEDGSSGMSAYGTYNPADVEYVTSVVDFQSNVHTDTITEAYNSVNNTKRVCRLTGGQLPGCATGVFSCQCTMNGYLKAQFDKFKADNKIANADFKVLEYKVVSLHPQVFLAINPADYDRIHAWTTVKTKYTFSQDYTSVQDYHTGEEWKFTTIDASQMIPRNPSGVAYNGSFKEVMYKVTALAPGYNVGLAYKHEDPNLKHQGNKLGQYDNDSLYPNAFATVVYEVTEKQSYSFTGQTTGPLTIYKRPDELVPQVTQWPDAHISIELTGGDEGPWIAFANDEFTRDTKDDDVLVKSTNKNEVIAIGTLGAGNARPWSGYTRWYNGCVNGEKPFYKDDDGKKDLYVPIDVDTPSNVTITKWYVETKGNENVEFEILDGVGNYTLKEDDVVRFYSNVKTVKTIGRRWYGPKVPIPYPITICGTTPIEFPGQVLAPKEDPILEPLVPKPPLPKPPAPKPPKPGKPAEPIEIVIGHFSLDENGEEVLEDEETIFTMMETSQGVHWETIVTSRNPNVAVTVVSEPNYTAEGGIFLPLKIKAYIINPIQTPWNPFVHNGYYYLNQKELFLYANQQIRGKFVAADGFQSMEFPYSVKVFCERLTKGAIQTWMDTYRTDYKGVANLVDLDTSLGDIILRKNSQGVYYASGTYTSDSKLLPAKPEYWDKLVWEADTPGTSAIKMESSTMDDGTGAWNAWLEVANGAVIPSPVSKQIRYRATLTAGMTKVLADFKNNYDTSADWAKGTNVNLEIGAGNLDILNVLASQEGSWESNVMDLGGQVEEMGTITWPENLRNTTDGLVEVFTMTADTATGPWDGTGEPWVALTNVKVQSDGTKLGTIASVKKRFLKVKYVLKAGTLRRNDYETEFSTTAQFSEGLRIEANAAINSENVKVENNEVLLLDPNEDGIYVSPIFKVNNIIALKKALLESTIPTGGSITLSTVSAATLADLEVALMDPANWTPLGAAGAIASATNPYIKIKADITAGRGTSTRKDVVLFSPKDFNDYAYEFTNTLVENDSVIGVIMDDPEFKGVYESKPIDFNGIETWIDLNAVTALNNGNILLYTSTSDTPFSDWEEWKPLGPTKQIESTIKRYIKFKAEFTGVFTIEENLLRLNQTAQFQNGVFNNMKMLSVGVGLTQVDPSTNASYTSPVLEFKRVTNYKLMNFTKALSQEAGLTVATRTSVDGVDWTPWDIISDTNQMSSLPYKYLQFRVILTPGISPIATLKKLSPILSTVTHLHENTVLTDEVLSIETLVNDLEEPQIGHFYSTPLDFGGKVSALDVLTMTDTLPATDGSIKVYTTTARTKEDLIPTAEFGLEDFVWTEATVNEAGDYVILSEPNRFLMYHIELTPGKDAEGAWISPTVTNVSIKTTATGFNLYEASSVRDIHFTYDYKAFESPLLNKVTISAMVLPALSPRIRKMKVTADVFNWISPFVSEATITAKVSHELLVTPILKSISFSAKMADRTEVEDYTISMSGSLVVDKSMQQISQYTMKKMVDDYFDTYNISPENLTRKYYELATPIPDIEMHVRNSDPSYFLDGLSEVYARSKSTSIQTQYSQSSFVVDDNSQVVVTPAPQQGAPVVVKDYTGREMLQVSFYDENDKLTLWYKDCGCTDGGRTFLLDHANFDPATLKIEVDETPDGPYTELKEGEDFVFCNNVVTFRKKYPEHVTIWYKYILKRSFIVDLNYDVARDSALITMHKPVLGDKREVGIAYETDKTTAYYKASEIDLNPMRTLLNEGFIYLTDDYHEATKLELTFNPNMLNADGKDRTTIHVIAKDRFGNPVVGDTIKLTVSEGTLDVKNKETDINGMVTAVYTASLNPGEVMVTAEDTTARLEATGVIHLRGIHPQPRAEIILSNTEITPDGIEAVKITARIVNETQERAVSTQVLFETTSGKLDYKKANTNYEGEAHNYIRATSRPQNGIMTIKVTVPEFNISGYANLLIKEVTQFV